MSRGRDREGRQGAIRQRASTTPGHEPNSNSDRTREASAAETREKTGPDGTSGLFLSRASGSGPEEKTRESSVRAAVPGIEKPLPQRGREEINDRDRTYRLRRSDLETLGEIGKFRTVAEDDLGRFRYQGDTRKMEYDLRSLAEEGLVQRRTLQLSASEKLRVVVLTKQGKRLLEGNGMPKDGPVGQHFYAGFVKPAEVKHDAAIYRMYQAEVETIRQDGGEVQRVVLDYELKKQVYSPLAKARDLPPDEYAQRRAEVAESNNLVVVDGKIPLPDLRIEYETREGEIDRVDLELATEHYRGSQMAAKALAGFKFYAPGSTGTSGSPVRDEREITADILSL